MIALNQNYLDFTLDFAADDVFTAYDKVQNVDGGYRPDVEATERFCQSLPIRRIADCYGVMDYAKEKKDVFLWLPLLEKMPQWQRGAQGIGDCVSWGWALGVDMVLASLWKQGLIDYPKTVVATEAIYGGSRVEADGGKLGGFSDGSYGGAAAKFVSEWGAVLRLTHNKETGVDEHDLTKYDKKKATSWGNFGCGGKDDAGRDDGKLDTIARKFSVSVARVKTSDELTAALTSGYPVPVCSGVGFGNMKRNADGVVGASGSWSHCMCYGGIRWFKGDEQYRLFQSWGKSCSGPDPGVDHEAVSHCSWWTSKRDAEKILRANDSFAVSHVEGFPPQILDWASVATSWGPGGRNVIPI